MTDHTNAAPDPMTDARIAEIEALIVDYGNGRGVWAFRNNSPDIARELLAALRQARAERDAAVTALKPFAGEAAWFKKTDADGRTLNSFQNTVYESNSFPRILTDNPAHRLRVFHFRDAADTLRQQEGNDDAR